jgi:hypothetical protein
VDKANIVPQGDFLASGILGMNAVLQSFSFIIQLKIRIRPMRAGSDHSPLLGIIEGDERFFHRDGFAFFLLNEKSEKSTSAFFKNLTPTQPAETMTFARRFYSGLVVDVALRLARPRIYTV